MSDEPIIFAPLGLARQIAREWVADKCYDATAKCKAAGKQFSDWRRLASTKELLNALSVRTGIPVLELIQSLNGGLSLGTWVHPKVAIALAMWRSSEFHVLVLDWVYEGAVKQAATWNRLLAELDARDARIMEAMSAQASETVRLIRGASGDADRGRYLIRRMSRSTVSR